MGEVGVTSIAVESSHVDRCAKTTSIIRHLHASRYGSVAIIITFGYYSKWSTVDGVGHTAWTRVSVRFVVVKSRESSRQRYFFFFFATLNFFATAAPTSRFRVSDVHGVTTAAHARLLMIIAKIIIRYRIISCTEQTREVCRTVRRSCWKKKPGIPMRIRRRCCWSW